MTKQIEVEGSDEFYGLRDWDDNSLIIIGEHDYEIDEEVELIGGINYDEECIKKIKNIVEIDNDLVDYSILPDDNATVYIVYFYGE